jgi:hypothetical protein
MLGATLDAMVKMKASTISAFSMLEQIKRADVPEVGLLLVELRRHG